VHRGRTTFAELLILDLLKEQGWQGVWVSSFGRLTFLDQMPASSSLRKHGVAIPFDKSRLLKAISQTAETRGGCFDVMVWLDDDVRFFEAKRRKRDSLRRTQLRWIEAALKVGVRPDALNIVEWELADGR
jgi:hypothetical protein